MEKMAKAATQTAARNERRQRERERERSALRTFDAIKNFHAERYLSLLPLLHNPPSPTPARRARFPRHRNSVFTGFHGRLFANYSPPLPPARKPLFLLSRFVLPFTLVCVVFVPGLTCWHNFRAVISTIFLSTPQFYLQSPIGRCGTASERASERASGQYGRDGQSAVRTSSSRAFPGVLATNIDGSGVNFAFKKKKHLTLTK